MTILIMDLADPDAWPCPEACGGLTEDPYGGPCKRCWDKIGTPQLDDAEDAPMCETCDYDGCCTGCGEV